MSDLVPRLRFALAFLREPQRVLAVCVTVALGTIALILADGFIEQTFRVFREDIIRAHFAHLQVVPASPDGRIPGGSEGDSIRAAVARSSGEAGEASADAPIVTGRLTFAGLIALGDRTVGFLGEGVEPETEATLSKAVRLGAGKPLTRGDEQAVLLGEGLARSIGATVGDKVTLLVNTANNNGVNAVELVVAGLFHTATKAYDDRALRLPLGLAHRLTRSDGVSRLMVLLPETERAPAAAERVRAALQGRGLEVLLWSDMADFYTKTVDLFRRQLGVVRTVILVIVLLATFNSMARKVLEQQREIGTMMALGARRRTVAGKFVTEALVMGVIGGLVGVACGAVLAAAVNSVGIPMPPPPGKAHGFTGGIAFSAGVAGTAFAAVVSVCVAASLVPALRASRVVIADALRADR